MKVVWNWCEQLLFHVSEQTADLLVCAWMRGSSRRQDYKFGYPSMLYSRIQPTSRLKMALTKLSYSQGWSSSVSFASPAHPPPAPCPEGSVPTKICIVLNTFQRRLCFPLEIFSSFSRWPLPTHSANSKLDWTCRIGHPLPLSTKLTQRIIQDRDI